ncbi:MAG TPA: hypothetical protein VG125_20175 [Pirellulales bacterium]|jgi:hypothetical protein|nr:hypothetical protein [Pirellulales bacterium]
MNRKQQPATWPFVLVLAALFALSVTSPRTWRRLPPHEAVGTPTRAVVSDQDEARVAPQTQAVPLEEEVGYRPLAGAEIYLRPRVTAEKRASFLPETTELETPAHESAAATTPAQSDVAESRQAGDGPSQQELSPPLLAGETTSSAAGSPPPDDQSTPPASAVPEAERKARVSRFTVSKRQRGKLARRAEKTASREPASIWGEPAALVDQLDQLAAECDTGEWATRVADLVRQLCRAEDPRSPRTLLALKRLRDLADANHPLLAKGERTAKKGELRRLRYAVLRRLDLWEIVPDLADSAPDARQTKNQTVSLSNRPAPPAPARAKVAKLLGDLERYEQTGLSDDGRDLAVDVTEIASSDETLTARTQRWLEWNYRNANLRLVVSNELLNRLVPQQPAVEEPVHDRILGVPTRGWSTSTARVSIRLIPDPQTVRFALEAKGIVVARTTSRRDPVTVYSNSDSAYLARKQLQLTADGLKAWPTEAEVSNSSRLRGIETDFDDVPIIGQIVEGIARAKHKETEPAVRRVARRKVASRVQEEIDSAMEPKLKQARQLYQERVLTPLEGLALVPAVIELQTSEARFTSRLRLAGDEQLAASTPRPMALSDSLASVQIHQSVINNICDRLNVDGQAFTLPELQKRLTEAFKLPPEALPEEYPTDLRITFAKRDAVTTRFDDGRIELTLGIAELHRFPKVWRNFQVRVYYRPRVSGLDVRFVRDGTVQLRSEHFGREPQIALRGIFSKVFSHDRELIFVDSRATSDPRLAGLSVTQCVLTDGWIGLSLGRASSQHARRAVSPLY